MSHTLPALGQSLSGTGCPLLAPGSSGRRRRGYWRCFIGPASHRWDRSQRSRRYNEAVATSVLLVRGARHMRSRAFSVLVRVSQNGEYHGRDRRGLARSNSVDRTAVTARRSESRVFCPRNGRRPRSLVFAVSNWRARIPTPGCGARCAVARQSGFCGPKYGFALPIRP